MFIVTNSNNNEEKKKTTIGEKKTFFGRRGGEERTQQLQREQCVCLKCGYKTGKIKEERRGGGKNLEYQLDMWYVIKPWNERKKKVPRRSRKKNEDNEKGRRQIYIYM